LRYFLFIFYLFILQIPQQQGALLRYFGQRLAAAWRMRGGAGSGLSWCVLAVQSWCVVRGRAPHLCPHVWHQWLRRWYLVLYLSIFSNLTFFALFVAALIICLSFFLFFFVDLCPHLWHQWLRR
jgi:hypothetical protein